MTIREWDDRTDAATITRRAALTLAAAALTACGSSSEGAEGVTGETEQDWQRCRTTTRDAVGPYYTRGAPTRAIIAGPNEPGTRLLISGRVLGPDCATPLTGYVVDVWQADEGGTYYMGGIQDGHRLRGKVTTNALGRFQLETIVPGQYSDDRGRVRPAHIHVKVRTATLREILATQFYFEGDAYLGTADYCTREGTCNSSDAARILALTAGTVRGVPGQLATMDIVLPRH